MSEQSPHIYKVENSRKRHIALLAEDLCAVYSAPPIPVLEIAESNGIDVVFHDLKDHSSIVAGFVNFKGAQMFINDELSMTDKAFTMAHELGHWMLHKDLFDEHPSKYAIMPRFQKPDLTSEYEVEANLFARHLLMPEKFLKDMKSFPPVLMAKFFMVSEKEVELRLLDE